VQAVCAADEVVIDIGENVEKIKVIKYGIIKGFLITSNYTRKCFTYSGLAKQFKSTTKQAGLCDCRATAENEVTKMPFNLLCASFKAPVVSDQVYVSLKLEVEMVQVAIDGLPSTNTCISIIAPPQPPGKL
jgi:hypothetical protein